VFQIGAKKSASDKSVCAKVCVRGRDSAGFRWWGPGARRGGRSHVRIQNV